jgi:hypothetical protein
MFELSLIKMSRTFTKEKSIHFYRKISETKIKWRGKQIKNCKIKIDKTSDVEIVLTIKDMRYASDTDIINTEFN